MTGGYPDARQVARSVNAAEDDPFNAASRVEIVCERVAAELGIQEPDFVFFDGSTRTFWCYSAE